MSGPSRREVLAGAGAGAIAVRFALPAMAQEGEGHGGALSTPEIDDARLDAWIRIGADGNVTVFTGKAELGQGVKTALAQIAAEELDLAPAAIALVTADTARTPNEGFTAGSRSIEQSGATIRRAAAQLRAILIAEAAKRSGMADTGLQADDGMIVARDGQRFAYGDLVGTGLTEIALDENAALKDPGVYRVVGRSIPRTDIPGKLVGAPAYVQDLRLPGMLHARVVRPPNYTAKLIDLDAAKIEAMPGVVRVVRDGSFLAVVADKEWRAIKAMEALKQAARWNAGEALPDQANLYADLQTWKSEEAVVAIEQGPVADVLHTVEAVFERPYQMHGSIGPSCAVAEYKDGEMTVWSHTQGVYPDRAAIAEMLRMEPAKVRVIHMEGAGCYGHNGADDAAADAALIARALPGRPVRVQWMREDEHAFEPYGPAMVAKVKASLGANGRIVDWRYDLWSNTHSTRPGPAGALLPARHLAEPFAPFVPKLNLSPAGNGDRNAIPIYATGGRHIVWHFLPEMPLRVSALRGLGAYTNVIAIESTMDELAQRASHDPVAFRLAHLTDDRARDTIRAVADAFGWDNDEALPEGYGRGFGFARYKNLAAWCAVAMEVAAEDGDVRVVRVHAAIDAGQAVNPDGLRNQTEGGIVQAISWTLYEAVKFDRARITSTTWETYPILRFPAAPGSIDVHIVDRPGAPFLGAAEAAQGPAAAALLNAIADATGTRLRTLPVMAAVG